MLLLYASANRDERQYGPDAAELDVTRRPRNIMTFSHGAHHCLGAAAARMQSRVALTELLRAARTSRWTPAESSGPEAVMYADRCRFRSGSAAEVSGWLAPQRAEAACDRILDAAGELFAQRGVEAVGMNDIARTAGCSRATVYRYFENRDALHSAYVHRHARAVNRRIGELVGGIADPRERMLTALTEALRLVRENPALSAWFSRTAIGAEAAEGSEVVQAMTAGFLRSMETSDAGGAQRGRHAGWYGADIVSERAGPGRG